VHEPASPPIIDQPELVSVEPGAEAEPLPAVDPPEPPLPLESADPVPVTAIDDPAPFRDLIASVSTALSEEPHIFFRAVDHAKAKYQNAIKDDLQKALIGLKVCNLLIAKHEYQRGAIVTTAHPVSFMLDTANQCQLGCPSCTNTLNREFADRTFNPWPRGILKEERFRAFIDSVGLTAFAGHFYNNHEPFLNKNTPAYLRVASDMQVETFVSSNLSFPKMDHEAIVRSGLKELMAALDGLTQESYERYRKGGRLEWAFANVRAIADAKKRLGATTPYLRWQWLTFAHNVHEVPAAIEFAKEIGFDSFNLATPNRVDHDDPTVTAVHYDGPDEHRAVVFNQRQIGNFTSDLEPYREAIESRLAEGALDRWEAAGGPEVAQPKDRLGDRCDWLHMAVISDAMGRIVPCCLGDYKGQGQFIFATIDEHHDNLLNSKLYQESRLLLANPAVYRAQTSGQTPDQRTRCLKCPIRPTPQIGLGAVHSWMFWSADPSLSELAPEVRTSLTNWSRHLTIRPNYETLRFQYAGQIDPSRFLSKQAVVIEGIGKIVIDSRIEATDAIVDVMVFASTLVRLQLLRDGVEKGSLESQHTGFIGFELRGMTTPGAYEIAFIPLDGETAIGGLRKAATINVSLGGVIEIVYPQAHPLH
jgi:MoaA/NifB/PqqE/SkfB family radical SAM enzyme